MGGVDGTFPILGDVAFELAHVAREGAGVNRWRFIDQVNDVRGQAKTKRATQGAEGQANPPFSPSHAPRLATIMGQQPMMADPMAGGSLGFFVVAVQPVQGAANTQPWTIHDVQIDHGRLHIGVPHQFLDRSDIRAVFKQVGGE